MIENSRLFIGKYRLFRFSTIFLAFYFQLVLFSSDNAKSIVLTYAVVGFFVMSVMLELFLKKGKVYIREYHVMFLLHILFVMSVSMVLYKDVPIYEISKYAIMIMILIFATLRTYEKKEILFLVTSVLVGCIIYSFMIIYGDTYYGFYGYRKTISIYGRALDPNFVSSALVIGAIIALKRSITSNRVIMRIFYCSVYFFIFFAIFKTQSRGAILGIATTTVMLLCFLYKQRVERFTIIIYFAVFILLLLMVYFNNEILHISRVNATVWEDQGRLQIWNEAIKAYSNHMLGGIGFSKNMTDILNMAVHNTFLRIITETGIIGTLLFIVGLMSIWRGKIKSNSMIIILSLTTFLPMAFLDGLTSRILWNTITIVAIMHTCNRNLDEQDIELV